MPTSGIERSGARVSCAGRGAIAEMRLAWTFVEGICDCSGCGSARVVEKGVYCELKRCSGMQRGCVDYIRSAMARTRSALCCPVGWPTLPSVRGCVTGCVTVTGEFAVSRRGLERETRGVLMLHPLEHDGR